MSAPYDKVIVVTGGYGSGKSTVSRMLADAGAAVVSADALAKEVVQPGGEILEQITSEFGPAVRNADGTLNRAAMANLVFSDTKKRERLEALTHPAIQSRAKSECERAIALGRNPVIYDCPLYFEKGLEALGFRAVVFVDAPEEECLKRVIARDGIARDHAESRLRAQLPMSQKRQSADFVIKNSGDLSELREKVESLVVDLRALRG